MLRSATQHAFRLGAVAFCALAVVACGAPDEEAKPQPLPDDPRELGPGGYRSEEFEPSLSFRIGEGWSSLPSTEAYDALLLTRGHEVGGWPSESHSAKDCISVRQLVS